MKLRNLFMAAIAGAFAFASCEEIPEELLPSISLNPTELTFEAGEGSQTVSLKATLNWRLSTSLEGSWVALSQTSGKGSSEAQTISVSVEANSSYDRTLDLVFDIGLSKATLKISQKGSQGAYVVEEGDGTETKPYNVGQAVALIQNLTWTSNSDYQKTDKIYVKGKIASIKYPYDFANGTATFDITDDGTASGSKITAYSLYYLGGNKWLDGNAQIAVGDIVVLYGEFQNYQGNTPETVKATSYLYSLNGVREDNNGRIPDFSGAEEKTIAEFIAAASTSTYYKVTGTVYGNINTQYGNFFIKDATGTLQVYGAVNWNEWKDKVKVNSKVTVAGTYKKYNDTNELVNGYILSCEDGEPTDYSAAPAKTVADFIAAADKANYYKLTGKVSKFNSNYCSFDLTDETGTIYVYSVANKDEWSSKIKDGGTVVLAGMYDFYASKSQHEVVNAQILSFEEGAQVDYSASPAKTVAEFITAADNSNYYKLTGKVSNFNATYCSFDLTDETGSIYVYSVDNKADWSSKVANDGVVTLAGKYAYYAAKEQHEVVNAVILSFEGGSNPGTTDTPSGSGTLDSPYNPKGAYDAAAQLEKDAKSENDVYIAGVISSIKYTFSAQYGTATFNISEDGTTNGTQFPCYSILYLGNRNWEEGDAQIAVGDEVVVCGKITNYQGSTPETASKEAYIYSINGQTSIAQSEVFGVESDKINVAATATSAVIKVKGNVSWTVSSMSAGFSPNAGEGAGEVTVTFPANTDTENTQTYNVTIKGMLSEQVQEIVVTIVQAKASSGGEKVITFDYSSAEGIDITTTGAEFSSTIDGVTLYLESGARNASNQDIRIYKGKKMTVSAASGAITKIVIKSKGGSNGADKFGAGAPSGYSATSTEGIWSGESSSVDFVATDAQVRMTSIEVTVSE